ncbi:glutamate-5-semialdehyde dehydrogenase [Candidatus Pelagibacter sp.]|jgi:glutamate-5-semialdehyde dehydrogenase|nr:glutamate-5-semialdehyde dehydrogenase [Candidatus Pelagibacter sp.]MDA9853820.1 glutamate-5-semialdehyde dehydrogenase [Candidatus Pelagibacter sp.]MDB3939266.1 glutamate-5-semialdehyde dehydrogenase [Candidatus Pelagibacter sp.]MDB3959868.1 glutamate-5-semialdehyde dehydrogenase [Candidatus Pelagibacter sp.]MDC1079762.1 glutamate-5-semialdehyde dehydrogenase [Candidatus Pelagibacter sp.]
MSKIMKLIGIKSRKASERKVDINTKNKVLNFYAKLLDKEKKLILKENLKDVKFAKNKGIKENLIRRLEIDEIKLKNISNSINKISKLKDPVNVTLKKWSRPNGLNIKRVTIPIGVIGVIFESRPNVTSDVAGLCFKSGNAVILKGGSEAINTNRILAKLFRLALKKNNVDENYIQFVDSKNRKMVDIMLSKMKKYIDVIIPRGGKNLVKRVQEFSTVPIIGHLEGICHTFVDKDAELKMASNIVYNAKLRNTAICGATETILLHEKIVKKFCNPILKKLEDENCKIYGDNILRKYYNGKVYPAKEKDWSTEYLTAAVSVKVVKSSEEAINHINKYGTMHTDSIITKNKKTANKFLKNVKSSIAMHNTSTQFADGGEFGFGGEVGISTNTLPPRGPVGLEQLVSYKYEISSKGKIRK